MIKQSISLLLAAPLAIVLSACSTIDASQDSVAQTRSEETHLLKAKVPPKSAPKYEPNEKSLSAHYEAPEWFRDAKLGIYFTWGPYTVAEKQNEWYPRWMHFRAEQEDWDGKKPGYHYDLHRWHEDKFGEGFAYHDMVDLFTAEHFDAKEWVDLFEASGARFAGPIAMHHDGFALWDSEITPWNSADTAPNVDVMGELYKELRKRGMKTVATFHHARHLQRYKGRSFKEATSRYGHLDLYHAYWNSHYPWDEELATSSDDPKLRLLYGNIPEDEWLNDFWLGTLKEVIDNYQPDLIWFDTWLDLIPWQHRFEFAAHYLNAASEWDKDVMITHKDTDMPETISVEDFEQGRRNTLTVEPWLTDDTISLNSWSYVENIPVKSSSRVLHDFIDIVSKNGQLLLNLSPKYDGTIPEDQRAVLHDIGEWLNINGEAIYETRPWKIYGEGPTIMQGDGHFAQATKYTPYDVRFTTRGEQIYAIALGTPEEELVIVALALNNSLQEEPIVSVRALGGDHIEYWRQEHDGLKIKLKEGAPRELAYAFKIGQ